MPSTRTKSSPQKQKRLLWPYLLVAPVVIFELLVHLIPMAVGVWMSFHDIKQSTLIGWTNAPVIGLTNYESNLDQSLVVGQQFFNAIGRSFLYTAVVVFVCWFIAVMAAIFLQTSPKVQPLFRTLYLIPYALPAFTGVIIWNFMLQRETGLINQVAVNMLGLFEEAPFWLIGDAAFWSMTVVRIWTLWPFAFLMLTAGMQSIPQELYQAAAVDGATAWQQAWSITLPMLRPVSIVVALVMFLWTFNDFSTPFVLFGNSVPDSADVVPTFLFRTAFSQWRFGEGAAASTMLMVFLIGVTAVYAWAIRRRRA